MAKRAFTLVEVLVCIGIILLIAGIAFPVMSSAKTASLKSVTRSNLRQLYVGLSLYRTQYDGSDSGSLYELGLPPVDYYYSEFAKTLTPPLAGRYPGLGWYYLMPPDPSVADPSFQSTWKSYSQKCGVNSILLVDVNFSDAPVMEGSPLLQRVGIGVRLDGSVSEVKRRGSPLAYSWWGCSSRGD